MHELTFLKQAFYQTFSCEPQVNAYAPGRVNLIGDHTDYNDGWVLPAAVNFGTHVLANPRDDRQIRVVAKDYDDVRVLNFANTLNLDSRYHFFDHRHLNQSGVEIFNTALIRELKKLE